VERSELSPSKGKAGRKREEDEEREGGRRVKGWEREKRGARRGRVGESKVR